MGRFGAIAFTPAVKAMQARMGSRAAYARIDGASQSPDAVGDDEREFLEARDSFYMATVGEGGWPYIQHRGGPKGIVQVLGPHTLGFADFRGNRQYVSAGNVSRDNRVALIVMDYAHRKRLKILGRMRMVPVDQADPGLVRRVDLPGYRARVEQVAVIEIEAFDWNCPQHITQRFTEAQVAEAARPLHERIAALEAQIRELPRSQDV